MADNKYLQNQRLAFDLLKKEGYTDIGDSAEALFKNRKNSEIAYDLLKKAGYTDIGKDYNEFAGLLYEPATSSESQYDPYETSSLSDAPGRARRYMRREEKASENRPTESDTPATEPAAPVNLTATSRLSQAPESTKAYLANPLVGKSTEELSAMMGELNDSEGLFAKEYERRNKAQTELARESDIAPEVDPAEIAWLKENSERYNAYKDKREKIADAFAHTTEYADILDANKEAENLAKEHTGAQAVIAQRLSPLNDEETKNWDAVRQLSHLTDKEARLGDKSAFTGEPDKDIVTAVTQFGSAALNNVDIDTITMGLASASAFMDARKIGEKYNRIVNEVMKSVPPGEDPTVAIYEALDNGLSESEIEVLKALDRYTYVTGIKASTASTAAKAGQAAEQSAEFMFDFLLTGGLAKGGAKTASKIMRGWVKQKAGRKGLTNVLGNMPEAMAKLSAKGVKPSLGATMLADMGVAAERTALMFPRNLNTYGEQLLQMGERGERGQYNFSRSKANAALNTALTQYIEYWSEGFGEYFGAGEKALFQWATKRAPSTLIGQTLSSYRGSIGKFLDYGKFNGMFNEMLEEAVGSTFNALNGWLSGDRVGDSEALKEFIAGDNLATLFFSFLPMSAISARTNIRAYNKMRERYDASVDALNPYLASGAISSEELDDLTGSIENSTPEQLKDRVVSLADKARKKNGGRLPENFAQSLMGYVEGALSMRMQSDVWDNSAQKREVVDAYADAYVNRQASDAWDAEHNEQVAHDAAIAAGFSEEQLDNDPYRLAQQAMMLEQSAPEASAALSAYATAKASREGLEEGYKNETSEFIDDYEREIRDNVDNNGTIISADLNGVRVFVTTKDATVNADGTISAGDGNGLVAVRSLDGSATNRAKAGDLLNASSQSTNEYLSQWAEDFSNQRAEYYAQAQSTVSPAGKMEMISGLAGQAILLQAPDGQVLSANIVNVDASTGRATIGIDGGMRVVSMTDLYDMAQKDANGNIALDPATVQAQPAEQPQQPAQPAAPSAPSQDLSALLGEDVTITLNGQPTTVNVADVDGGKVYFTYGNTSGSMTEQEFSAAMQTAQTPAPAETETTETRETPAQPETPQSTLPMKDGEVDVDNLFNVDEQTFATRIPELVAFYQQMLGDNALKEVQKAYAAAGEAVKKQQEKIDKNTDLKKAPGLYKTLADLQRDRKNIGALLLAMTPKRETKAPAAQAPATETPAAEGETNVPDISNDTPEAAQKRGYVMQNGNRIDRSADDTVAVEGKDTRISFAKNEVVDAKYGLIDAGRIVPSHVSDQENPLHFFAKKWQPKNRKKADSATAIQQMANGLRPEEITRGATAYVGAPIVNSRGEVIQGNGRSEALRRAYTQGTASDYKAWLAEHADEFGLTREQVESMENPILVRKVDVDDARAEELGQFAAGDLESGGDQTFTARGLAKKLGNKLGDVLNLLFGGELEDDATITDYINANGQTVLSWLRQNGYINDTEQQNAVSIGRDEEPRFTEATVSAFRELSLEPLFANAPEKVRAGYEKLSNIAKLALQKSAANLAGLEGVIADLQEALAYFYDFETADPAFQKAKTVEEAWKAIEDWMMNIQLGSETSEADLHPSLVAKRFAARFKGAKKAKSLTDLFNAIAVAMQGETTLYGTTEATDRIGAYEQTNIISEEEANRLRNGEQDNNERGADDGAGVPGEQRGRGGEGATGSGEEAPAESSATDTGASGETEGTQEEVAEGPKEEPAPAEKIGGTIPEVVEEQVEEVTQDPLTEDEIRNSGYDDPSIIEQAVDYIHGNTGNLLNQVAYQLIEDYVRNKHMGQQSAGGNGQRVSELGSSATGSRGAAGQRSGGEDGQVGEGGSAEGVSGTAGVQPGREGDSNGAVAATGERGNSRRGGLSGSGSSVRGDGGGSSGNRGRGRELHDDGRGKAESGASSRSDESGQNQSRREQLDSEIEDLLGQLGDTLKGFSKPDGTLGVSIVPGMSATQLQALAKAAKLTAQIGYRLLLKGYYTLADYIARLGDTIRDVLKKAGLTDDDVDRFIRDSWDALYTVDGETHRIREWASILKDREFRRMAELSYEEKKKLQKEANERKSKVELADSANIQEQLPFLFQHQIENVVKAEKQFFGEEALSSHERAYGKGMMFTDGTGTGKTYTGLGIIKRFVNQGKKRILLVCPAGKVVDWQKDASNLGLSPEALMTKGKGSGFVVMSYESFRANQDIMEDTFDLVVYDEAHKMMSSVQASPTKALTAHFAITNRNQQQALERIQQNHELWKLERDLNATIEYQEGKLAEGDADAQSIIDKCNGELNQVHEKQQKVLPELEKQAEDAVKRTKVLFLTATPFNNERNMQYADGYIFNSQGTAEQVVKRANTNDGQFKSSENDFDYWLEKTFPAKFYISNGKAQERRGNATKLDQEEISWNEHAKELGVLSGQKINIPFDYSRDFPIVSIEHQVDFNSAIEDLRRNPQFSVLQASFPHLVGKSGYGNYNWTSYLWEVMKVSGLKDRIDQHLAMGRKVVIFNRRRYRPGEKVTRAELKKQGMSDEDIEDMLEQQSEMEGLPPMGPPFAAGIERAMLNPDLRVRQAAAAFAVKYASLLQWEKTLDYRPIEEQFMDLYATQEDRKKYAEAHAKWEKAVAEIRNENEKLPKDKRKTYPAEPRLKASGIGLVRGSGEGVTNKSKLKDQDTFNNTDKMNIIIVQESSGKEGISLHDTTGEHQRVLISTALPQSPLTFIQIEGRIYRLGNKSNAIYEYPLLGINLETSQFAGRINTASQTTENLAMGEEARGLRESIKNAVLHRAGIVPLEGQGHGGKDFDQRVRASASSRGFDGAIQDYKESQSQLSEAEKSNADMAITPHPLGYKMAQWAQATEGETFLEPSAGQGILAQYVPGANAMTALETDGGLFTRLSVAIGAANRTLQQKSIREYSPINKHDIVLMHPPVGGQGTEAAEQFIEAAKHLEEGGRLIAVVPQGLEFEDATIRNEGNLLRVDGVDYSWEQFWDKYGILLNNAGGWISTFIARYVSAKDSKSNTLEKMRAQLDEYKDRLSNQAQGSTERAVLEKKIESLSELIGIIEKPSTERIEPGSDTSVYKVLSSDEYRSDFTKVMKGLVKVGEIKLPNFAIAGDIPMKVLVYDQVTRKEAREMVPDAVSYDVSDAKDMDDFFEKIRNLSMPARTVDNLAKIEKVARRFANAVNSIPDILPKGDGAKASVSNGLISVPHRTIKDWEGSYFGKHGATYRLSDIFPFLSNPDGEKIGRSTARWYRTIAERLKLGESEYAQRISRYGDTEVKNAGAIRQFEEALLKFFRDASGLTETQIGRVADGLPAEIGAADLEGTPTAETLKAKFDIANGNDDFRLKMFNKVLDKGEKSGLNITNYKSYGNDAGLYYPSRHSLEINVNVWNRLSNEQRAQVVCHEALHSATTLPLEVNERLSRFDFNSNEEYAAAQRIITPEVKSACDRLENLYRAIQRGEESYKVQGYGLSNSHEMIAELANPKYREALASRSLWIMPDGSFSGFEVPGAKKTDALTDVTAATNALIDSFNAEDYQTARAIINGDAMPSITRGLELEEESGEADNILFREETDEDVLERLESEPKIKVYRAMQLIDGNLYPPMSAKVDGKMREPIAIGKWERAEERPELADNKGNFVLNKGNGSSLKAKYNPYIHTSRTPLNDQFTSAYNRPNLVTVEVEIPESELTSGYKAEKAKDAVGEMTWHSGPVSGKLPEGKKRKVILSRWDKPVRVLPNSEVADRIAELLDGENIAIPYNVVTPELRAELAQRGVRISDRPSGTVKNNTLRSREANTVERRVAVAEYRAVNDTLDTMSQELGIKINRVSRDEMPRGHKRDKGYYNPRTGEMTICMDNVSDLRDVVATVLHETVGHHGLRQLFGASFNDAMRDIYAHLDAKGRRWVHDYMVRHNLQPGDADAIIRGMEEYLSHLAESGDFKNSVWDDIKEILGKLVDAIFGTDGFTFTDNELNYILRASYENLKDPNWLNTAEGRARDILLKRELGINETDPTRPTDPQGPLFRDGENISARDNYETELQSRWNNIVMEHQDADQPVRLGMDAIMKEVGKTTLDENEDFLTRHNLVSSRAETEAHEFELFHFTPLLEQVREIQSKLMGNRSDKAAREDAYHRTLDYLYAVSALERNEYKNNEVEQQKQDALQAARTSADAQIDAARDSGKSASEISRAIDAIEKRLAKQESDINEAYEEMKKDWSGLTSLMGRPKEEWREAEDDARAMVEAFRSEVNDDAALEELWNRIRSCTDYSLEHAYKYGLLTREEFERLHGTESQPRMWNYYLPLRGFSEETAEEAYSYSNMVHPQTNSVVVKKINGRWTQADNPIANILNIAETEIVQGNENWAKQALYRFVLNAGENSLLSQRDAWFVKNPADGTWSLAEPEADETLEEFEARMQALRDLDEPLAKKTRKGLKLDRIMANKAHKNEHIIRLKVGGMEKMIWVNGNPAIAQAVTGQNRGNNYKTIRRASRALSNLFTTYSLDFTARNLIRDTIYSQMALIAKEDSAYRHQFRKNWIRNFGYGAFAYPMVRMMAEWESGKLQRKANPTPREQMFMDFMRDGGQTGYTIINSVKDIKDSLERSMRRAGKKVNSVSIPILGHYAKFVKTLNEGFELLTRFTAYQTSRDMGRSGQRAASDAKEISVNFNRRGAQSKGLAAYLGATHYFYNAGVQGFENFLRLFKTAPVKMTVGTGSLVFLAMLTPLLNSALAGLAAGMGDGDGGGDDDWYWNLPEWVRRNNLILGTGSWYLAIPLSVELRAFYGLGDIAASLMYHKATARNGFEIGLDAINTAAGILPVNPIEGYTSNGNIFDAFLRTAAPDATMFIVDIATNRDFTGRPLRKENPFSDTTPRSQSAFASTPKALVEACQWLARETNGGIDLAPGEVRDILKNLGGGFYRAAEDVTKLIYSDEERPRRWDDIPFFSGFTGHLDEDRSNSFASSASYNYKKLSESVVRRINAAAGSSDITAKMVYETPEQLPKSARVQRILEGENYILGKMYREGMNNEYLIKQRKGDSKYGKKGEWYKSKEIARKGVATLKEEWKAMREQYAAMPDKTEEEKAAKAAFLLDVQDAWHKYYDAEANLVDQLMEEEYNHVQQRRKNGIPYEPKTTTSQKVYDFAKELVQ